MSPSDDPNAGKRELRLQLIEAATRLFSRHGYRRATVDQIAAEARVAKGTLYAYFDDKDAIFRAVCQHVCDDYQARAATAARRATSVEASLVAALVAKYTYVFELVDRSPHAQELFDSQGRLAADVVEASDRHYHGLLVEILEQGVSRGELDEARPGVSLGEVAWVLTRSARGASLDAKNPEEHRAQLRALVRVVLRGVAAR